MDAAALIEGIAEAVRGLRDHKSAVLAACQAVGDADDDGSVRALRTFDFIGGALAVLEDVKLVFRLRPAVLVLDRKSVV